uniref:tumor necrosis factor receptor superfamily member 5-like n=1 Tax=Pristiophorus japonicus TaxID=55135 RepID=UPI00398E43EA
MMLNPRLLACCMFCLFQCCPVSSNACDSVAQYSKFGKCCSKCPAGTYTRSECTEEKDAECHPCGHGLYQSEWNTLDHCQMHKSCNSNGGFEVQEAGTVHSNTICRCQAGKHCVNKDCEICKDNDDCERGYGLIDITDEDFSRPGCEKCKPGYFSNITSKSETCRKWTDCGSLQMLVNGTATTDVICGTPEPPSKVGLVTVIIFLSALLAAIVLSFFIFYGRNQENRTKIMDAISRLLKSGDKAIAPIQERTENGRIVATAGDEDKCTEDGTELLPV